MADQRDIKYTVSAEDRFNRTFTKLKTDLGGVKQHSETALAAIGKLNAGLGVLAFGVAAGGAGVVAGLKSLAHDLDALNDASDAIGDSVERISSVEDVARRNGESLDLVTTAALKLNKALGENDPNNPTVQALKAIGLSTADLRKQSPVEALQTIALALQGYANDGNRARIIQELFGKSTKDVAGFLGDLAQAGKLNATVTTEQAQEAEKFNKELASLQTNANNAARAVASDLIPAINRLFAEVKTRGIGGGLMAALGFDDKFFDTKKRADLGKEMRALADQKSLLELQLSKDFTNADTPNRQNRLQQIVEIELPYATAQYKKAIAELDGVSEKGQQPFSDARNAAGQKKAPALPGAAKPQTEADRYLETLQRQGEKVQELTLYEQLLLDIQKKRIDGLNPAMEKRLKLEAKHSDQKKLEWDLKNREVATESALAKARLDGLDAMSKENIELQKEIDAIGLTAASLADIEIARNNATIATKKNTIAKREDAGVGDQANQVLYAEIEALEKRNALIVKKVGKEAQDEAHKADLDKLAKDTQDTIGSSLEQGLLDGVRRGEPIYKVFLRELEAQFAKTILTPIIRPIAIAGNSAIEELFSNIAGKLFGFGQGIGITSGDKGLVDYGLGGGRANGGSVRAGGTYRVNENGTETFRPNVDGVILSGTQSRQQAAQAAPVVIHQTYHINGDVSPQTIQAMQAMIARNNQQLLRSARTGGAFSS